MSVDPSRTPVVVGVGSVNDRPDPDTPGMDPVDLMANALRTADADAGGGFLGRCDRLFVVPQISFRELDVPDLLSKRLDIPLARIRQAEQASGDTPIRHLNDAANAIRAGETDICVVTGGEALRTAARRAAAAPGGGELFKGSRQTASELRRRYGVITPTEIYPLFENATRAIWKQTLAEAQGETSEIWSRMSAVAALAEGAWLRKTRSPAEIIDIHDDNRRIAFPYTKLMVANASVNQGAAFIVTSLKMAREAGVPEARLIFVGSGAAAHEPDDPLARASWDIPPGMRVSLETAMRINGLSVDNLDHVELYSCFPCVPKMARRVIGWRVERPVTVHGGLTFGGGPIGNYMSHAVVEMVRKLRRGGENGLLFANGGHCTHNHTIVLSRQPPERAASLRSYDYQAEADSARPPIPLLTDAFEGLSAVETYTVIYNRAGASTHGVVLSRNDAGERIIARVDGDDAETIDLLTNGAREPVGMRGRTERRGDSLHWRPHTSS